MTYREYTQTACITQGGMRVLRTRGGLTPYLKLGGCAALLLTRTYTPGPYTEFVITTPKRRMISAAPYRDRVVHHALVQTLEPLLDPTFIYDSYACRLGKGAHRAVERFTQFCRHHTYVLKCDIQKYFPSIDHTILGYSIKAGHSRTC